MKCAQCGEEHAVEDMELTFLRPDDAASLTKEERALKVQESSDLCVIEGKRFFVRTVLPLPVIDIERPYNIGLWVEVQQPAFERIYELWSNPSQASEPPFPANIANTIPTLPRTIGLSSYLQLTGPSTRPSIALTCEEHPLYVEQQSGITSHRAYEYSALFA